jgi:hypothetical protein
VTNRGFFRKEKDALFRLLFMLEMDLQFPVLQSERAIP